MTAPMANSYTLDVGDWYEAPMAMRVDGGRFGPLVVGQAALDLIAAGPGDTGQIVALVAVTTQQVGAYGDTDPYVSDGDHEDVGQVTGSVTMDVNNDGTDEAGATA